MTLPIIILAGGQSARMGQDKALLPVAGIPMLHRIVATARKVSPEVAIIGCARPADWPAHLNASFLPDDGPAHAGPISGLQTALEVLTPPLVLLACDTPLLTAETIRLLIAAHGPPFAATIAITTNAKGLPQAEPLLAVYTAAILPELDLMRISNHKSLQPLINHPEVQMWPVPVARQGELLNVNDPASLAAAEAALSSKV